MRASLNQVLALSANLDRSMVEKHLESLDDNYFDRFSLPQIVTHLEKLSLVNSENPAEALSTENKEQILELTVISSDYPGVFSLIAGILASMGFNIISGEIFTYKESEPLPSGRRINRRKLRSKNPEKRRIIDHFVGKSGSKIQTDLWFQEFKKHLSYVIKLLENGDESSSRKARQRVNEMVTQYLQDIRESEHTALYPVEINIDNSPEKTTRLKVVSQDTPAFLYAMSTSLSLIGMSIEHLRIRTILGKIEDIIDIRDRNGNKVVDREAINKLKLSVLMTKQFTYFLDRAPDPYAALSRFEKLVEEAVEVPEGSRLMNILSDPLSMNKLAKLLGASDFLWEDFIRLQYEELLPILEPHMEKEKLSVPIEELAEKLKKQLTEAETYENKKQILNGFKDRELFLIDLNHILKPEFNFRLLAEKLTRLAELIVNSAAEVVFENLCVKYGKPQTVAGIEAQYAIFGLGKFGGAALGYASDIELIFIYSDNGQTDGSNPVSNVEFFSKLVMDVSKFIETRKKGIFELDLRLRPHGDSGPAGVSLENFCKYYGPEGSAHSYERLALVRLRATGGDKELGSQIERIRDEYVYTMPLIDLEEIRDLRNKQFEEKNIAGRYNAKFSPGALVDLEYSVQLLQVMSRGEDSQLLRTPRIHKALEALKNIGILSPEEHEELNDAYDFLRQLINGLRMLRGSAKDLFLPSVDSDEFLHLARRMGYSRKGELNAAQQLFVEFETRTAIVRSFVEKHLGRDSLPASATGNIVDVIINPKLSNEVAEHIMLDAGFSNISRAITNFKSMAGEGRQKEIFIKLAVLACDMLKNEASPDMALNNWERFIQSVSNPQNHYSLLFSQPKRLEILLKIFAGSQFLADTLIRNPEFFQWVSSREVLYGKRQVKDFLEELNNISNETYTKEDWLSSLSKFRKREILRIGTRDICLGFPMKDITADLSNLADSIIEAALRRIWRKKTEDSDEKPEMAFCVMAFGKLGGSELNYSSDIDLMGIYDPEKTEGEQSLFGSVMEELRSDLSKHCEEGYAYRVDLRLRPYGRSGNIVPSFSSVIRYYSEAAELWEIQAALKLRPAAGSKELGIRFLEELKKIVTKNRKSSDIVDSIKKMREASIFKTSSRNDSSIDVKTGRGGIRDIEFLVQGIQLALASENPELINPNTLESLELFRRYKIFPSETIEQLEKDYIFLRKVEHCLQILEDMQLHSLPENEDELLALARRVSGPNTGANSFRDRISQCLERVHDFYSENLENLRH